MILVHHAKKGAGANFLPIKLQDASWSGFGEHARQWLLLNRRERFDPETGIHKLWMSTGGSAGHHGLYVVDIDEGQQSDKGGRKWVVTVAKGKVVMFADRTAKRDTALLSSRKEIIEAVVEEGAITKTALKDSLGWNRKRFGPAFQSLVDDGKLQPATVNKDGRKYEGWEVSE